MIDEILIYSGGRWVIDEILIYSGGRWIFYMCCRRWAYHAYLAHIRTHAQKSQNVKQKKQKKYIYFSLDKSSKVCSKNISKKSLTNPSPYEIPQGFQNVKKKMRWIATLFTLNNTVNIHQFSKTEKTLWTYPHQIHPRRP